MAREKDFLTELSDLINRHSMENGSDTPDFILAQYMNDCLSAFNYATLKRDAWHQNSVIKSILKKEL